MDIQNTYTDTLQLQNDWGEPFYVGFRRFIVVATDEGHSTCVYVLTGDALRCVGIELTDDIRLVRF